MYRHELESLQYLQTIARSSLQKTSAPCCWQMSQFGRTPVENGSLSCPAAPLECLLRKSGRGEGVRAGTWRCIGPGARRIASPGVALGAERSLLGAAEHSGRLGEAHGANWLRCRHL